MRQIIPFKKEIVFRSTISEIISISLEHTLHIDDDAIVSGEFIVSGQYKMTMGEITGEDFYYNIPFEISIDDKYDISNVKIDIDDFYYEVIDNNILKINIDVAVDGLEIKSGENISKEATMTLEGKKEFEEMINEEDKNLEMEINKEKESELEEKIMDEERIDSERGVLDEINITDSNIKETVKTLFDSFDDSTETFATYSVYIVRESDSLESILLKYNVTKEELADYNNLEEIKIGTKLIIPASIKYE
jgi:LysM repeat protein